MAFDQEAEQSIVARTEGLTGAFIRELMREAVLRAALEGRPTATGGDVSAAHDVLLEERSILTRRLLGQGADGAATPQPAAGPFNAMLHAFGAAGLPIPESFDQD